jgi:hypothetical protein
MPAAMAAMRASPPMTPPTMGPTGVELACGMEVVGVGVVDVWVDVVVGGVWVENVGVLDVVVGAVAPLVGFVNTRPICPM